MACSKRSDALTEEFFLFLLEEGGADADALFVGAHGVEREDCDAVVHEFAGELEVVHARILHGEVEAVGKRCAHVVVIDEVEAVGQQYVLHEAGAATVLLDVVEEVVAAVACCLHKGCHGVLYAVGSAA